MIDFLKARSPDIALTLATSVLALNGYWNDEPWLVVLAWLLVLVSHWLVAVGAERARKAGLWEERVYVVGSLIEATRRDMDFNDWYTAYIERAIVDAQAEGVNVVDWKRPPD